MNKNLLLVCCVFLLEACSNKPYQVDLMEAPGLFGVADISLHDQDLPLNPEEFLQVFYATDRFPSDETEVSPFYENNRGHVVRLGQGSVEVMKEGLSWSDVRDLEKTQGKSIPLQVTSIKEFGALSSSLSSVRRPNYSQEEMNTASQRYADAINEQLARSDVKDIYLYTHGYKVQFDDPLLVAAELWHFVGYKGVFVAYSWPSTPSLWAYASDIESAVNSSHNLRKTIEFLADNTDAERIHILGYSAGTRVVINALLQMALLTNDYSDKQIQKKYRLGEVVLVASDFDRFTFVSAIDDGVLRVPQRLTVYTSGTDKALNFSQLFFGRNRLGSFLQGEDLPEHLLSNMPNREKLEIVDVTNAQGANIGKGHEYFRRSPWVSSDVLLSLRFGFTPEERGLTRKDGDALWYFPKNYLDNLKDMLLEQFGIAVDVNDIH